MEFRIAPINDDPRGVLTGAFVFSPPPHLPEAPRVLVEQFGAENTRLGRHGWAVDSRGLRPRLIEKRGNELWLCFGAEVSFHVLPNTPVRVAVLDTDIEGTEIWPPIPRGKAPPADVPDDDAPWPEPAMPGAGPGTVEPKKPTPPPADQPKAETETETIIRVAPREQPPPLPDEVEPAPPIQPPPIQPPPIQPPPVAGPSRGRMIAAIAAVLLAIIGGGVAWLLLHPQAEQQVVRVPPPTPVPAPPPAPAPPGCAEAADVMAGRCTPEQMGNLPPAEQTRLAEALLALPDRRAGDVAISLLNAAVSRHRHPPAMLQLGRLYDPATFRAGGPLRAPNPARALDLFGTASAAGLAEAGAARTTLVERLKREAAGSSPEADNARAALAAAGIQ